MVLPKRKIENDTKINRLFIKYYSKTCSKGFIEVGEGNFCLQATFSDIEEQIRNFEVRDDDVFIVSHPKTGTNWCQEMVWLIANNFDYQGAKENIAKRFPILEARMFRPLPDEESNEWRFSTTFYEKLPSPRLIKSHLPWPLLPEQIQNGTKKPKIINILRNPGDVCVSYYHHSQKFDNEITLEELCNLFLAGKYILGPFWSSLLSIWQERHRPNILFLKYADMKRDLPSEIKKVANFLEKPITDEQVKKLVDHLSIDAMKKNPAIMNSPHCFIRRGEEGGYKSEMTPEQIEKFNEWEKKNLQGTDLTFE